MREKHTLFSFFLLIIVGCSTNNGSTIIVPIAPANLTIISFSRTEVGLSWTDISTNEDGYRVQRKSLNGTFSDVGSTGSDSTSFIDVNLSPGTTYIYRVYAYNSAGNSLTYSNEVSVTTVYIDVPIVTTTPVTSISSSTGVGGGSVINDNGAPVTVRGVIWSTSSNPTIVLNTKTADGTGTGSFSSNIIGLSAYTTYYVRAYATNSAGTSYGNEEIFTTTGFYTSGPNLIDINGNVYPSIITICGQTWISKNLNVSRYRNGDIIPQISDSIQWRNSTSGAWCWYNNDSANYWQYGKLYNWYAVNDPRGLAPQGWHVPNESDWNQLVRCIDPNANIFCDACPQSSIAGGAMKAISTWNTPNTGANNSSGFTALSSGLRTLMGEYSYLGSSCNWWTTNEYLSIYAYRRYLWNNSSNISRGTAVKATGFSVRLLKD